MPRSPSRSISTVSPGKRVGDEQPPAIDLGDAVAAVAERADGHGLSHALHQSRFDVMGEADAGAALASVR